MAVGTGAAILGGSLIGGAFGLMQSRDARRAAQAAGGPQPFEEHSTSTTTPFGPLFDPLLQLAGIGFNNAFAPLPQFPTYQPFGFHQLPSPDIHFADYTPVEIGQIPGASGVSRGIIQDILALAREKGEIVDPAIEALGQLLEGPSEILGQAQGLLTSGGLVDAMRGTGNPFEERVVQALINDIDRALEEQLGDLRSNANAVTMSGSSGFTDLQAGLLEEAVGGRLADAVAALRSGNFESERGRQLQATLGHANLAQALAAIRSGELQTAISTAPALEAARFAGFDIAGPLSLQADRLAQAARMAEIDFALRNEFADTQFDAMANDQLLRLFGIEVGQNTAANQLAAANAQAQNAFNLQEFGFNVESPFLRLQQALGVLLPIAGLTSGQTNQIDRSGFSSGPMPPFPSSLSGFLSGGLGGALLGLGLKNQFGGGGQQLDPFFSGQGVNPFLFLGPGS